MKRITVGASHKKRLLALSGVLLIILLAGGAGVGLRWWQNRGQIAEDSGPSTELPQEIGELQDLRNAGEEVTFNAKLDEALNDPSTDDNTRYQLYIQQGQAEFDKENWQGAIDAYLKAESFKDTMEVAELLADVYVNMGNNAKAIEYYKKAVTLVSDTNPRKQSIQDWYKRQIEDLGGQS